MKIVLRYIVLGVCFIYFISCKSKQAITASSSPKTHKPESKNSSTIKQIYSEKLGVPESDIGNEKLYKFIDDWYGVTYKYAGKDKSGIDCSGLAAMLYLSVYNKTLSSNTKALFNEVKKIKLSDLKEGDLVFFITNGKTISHVGVYLQNHKFVHASTKKGVMISDMNEPYFKQTYSSSGRAK